jgi:DNA repair protein RadC
MKKKEIPNEELPRERLYLEGADKLSNSDLLAIILGTGTKKESIFEITKKIFIYENIETLSKKNLRELEEINGIGKAKACKILACFEIGKRYSKYSKEEKPKISCAKDVIKRIEVEMKFLEQEVVKGIFLDIRNRVVEEKTIFIGSLNEAVIHPREIFSIAIRNKAAAIIIAHNHPSGDYNPSMQDKEVTTQIKKAGELMGIEILDHIIISQKGYFSFKEENLI